MEPTLNRLELPAIALKRDRLPDTIAERTQRVYDRLAAVYPASTFFFHSKAHKTALEMSGLRDGMRVLEVATGSGEMFRRLVHHNPRGQTFGIDLSSNMAARTHQSVQRLYPHARLQCQAVDARYLPFAGGQFDAIFCCYLFELLGSEDIARTMREIHRVLRIGGIFTVVLIGQNTELFNRAYRVAGSIAPAFWGRQVEDGMPNIIRESGFRITGDRFLRQGFYPSRVLTAARRS